MTDGPSHDEIDAKLAAVEARTETMFVRLDAKIDRLADAIIGEQGVVAQMKDVKAEMREVKADNKATRTTIVVTVVGGVIAALAALWATQSNLLSAVQLNLSAHPPAAERSAPVSVPAS